MGKFKEPLKNRNCFHSYVNETFFGFLFRSFIMVITSWFIRRKIKKSDMSRWFCKTEPVTSSIEPKITWVGHASFLIQVGGINILTDPLLRSPSTFFPRYVPLGIPFSKLPNIDFVLLSHNHPDHMDSKSLMQLKKHNGTHFLVPQGDKLWFENKCFARVREYTWWESSSFVLAHNIAKQITFTFLPANHWSMRGLFNRKNSSLWGGWMIECLGHKIYFAGDTAYESHFKEISAKFPNIDIALMPIGPCEKRDWVKHSHVDAKEAIAAFLDLQAKYFIPMHWGTFPMGAETFDTPLIRLQGFWKLRADELSKKELHILKVGQRFELSKTVQDKVSPIVVQSIDQAKPVEESFR